MLIKYPVTFTAGIHYTLPLVLFLSLMKSLFGKLATTSPFSKLLPSLALCLLGLPHTHF